MVSMIKLQDQCGRPIALQSVPKRIISLVPSLTELLVDLGFYDQLVGITKFCVHPLNLKAEKAVVGGTKTVNVARIKYLNPDFILANKEENTAELVTELEKFCPVYVSDIETLNDNIKLIVQLGALLDCADKAQEIVKEIEQAAGNFALFLSNFPSKTAAYFIWKKPYMVAGGNTFINHLMQLCHFENCFSKIKRYPEINLQTNTISPEIILLSSEPFPFKEADAHEIASLFPKSKVLIVDGEMFSWYGTRPLKAFTYFKKLRLELT
jgi:iron complex transport system substrate-binding protein